jgi:pimeloyl-ACP methyl ester carboxylesterase
MGLMAGIVQYTDGYWWAEDGLRLHYRDYAGPKSKPPIICIPGLTRNARDFEHVAERLAGDWRVICVELRGRGESAYAKTPLSYAPLIYAQDIEALLAELKIKRFVSFGTSLGGIVTMLLASMKKGRIVGALLNDIGPVIEAVGVERIRSYVGKSVSWPTWVHAARDLAELQGHAYPDYTLVDWIAMAKRLNRLTSTGRIVPDYDAKIAEPMRTAAEPVDLWPAYDALGDVPVTILRGGLSDILSAETAKAMAKRLPGAKLVTLPRIGHAPALDEPASNRAIDALLQAVAG